MMLPNSWAELSHVQALEEIASAFRRQNDFMTDPFSRLQPFLYVQALRFARLPDRSYRCDLSPQGSRGFYVRAEHASLPPHASDMLTTCPGNWWCGDLHPTRFTGSKIVLLMPDFLRVRLGSQGFGVSGSFAKCVVAWTSRRPRVHVPHNEHCDANLSRSTARGGAQWPRSFCCVRDAARNDDRRSRRCSLCV